MIIDYASTQVTFHGWYGIAALLKGVLCKAFTLKHRRFLDRFESNVVIGATYSLSERRSNK